MALSFCLGGRDLRPLFFWFVLRCAVDAMAGNLDGKSESGATRQPLSP
jgi:hypothetical protein